MNTMKRASLALVLAASVATPAMGQLAGQNTAGLTINATKPANDSKLTVTSRSFEAGGAIPLKYSAYGDNVAPELSWSAGPAGTMSYIVIVEDPDLGPTRPPYLHWILGDLTATTTSLTEGLTQTPMGGFQTGASIGQNKLVWFGPRPPSGVHNYTFQVFALDKRLGLYDGSTVKDVRAAMDGHVLASGVLQATYAAP
ncbi:MAG: YbhB/YbcL family Raf kinase inhibitor-like protein [Alphaproteobacteria bacterium]|nr:YbhB/YbcL family Raf kinase inhibitor-like protein [Alphaproteobacteria bacterium]